MASQKTAIVTGCGVGGIGHALSSKLRKSGFNVISTLLPFEDDEHLLAEGISVARTDVTKEESVLELVEKADKLFDGRLDVLINNAGICYTMTAADTDVNQVQKMFSVNVFGPMRMVHHFHRQLIASKGTVVNIGSVGGIVPYIYGASYNASKAALHHYGNTLRAEMKPFGVKVVNIISGEVSTNILKTDQKNSRTLPEGSVYEPLSAEFSDHIHRTPNTITPQQYAEGVIREILKPKPSAWFWYGAQTSIVRYGDMLLPRTIWDWLFSRMFKLDKLTGSANSAAKA